MKLIVHDLPVNEHNPWMEEKVEGAEIVAQTGRIHSCSGCFGCWVRTPGRCVLKDSVQNLGERLARCDELIIISQCLYGSYSPFVRNILDRSISYLLPYFVTRNGETHHGMRYKQTFKFTVHFYGDDLTEAERTTAQELVNANAIIFYAHDVQLTFHDNIDAIKEGWQ